jgi:hypothetical protein
MEALCSLADEREREVYDSFIGWRKNSRSTRSKEPFKGSLLRVEGYLNGLSL